MKRLIRLLGRYGHVSGIEGMEDPLHYRCRVNLAVGRKKGKMISGRYELSTHRIVENDSCLTDNEAAAPVMKWIRDNARSRGIVPFDDASMTGDLRHVQIRVGLYTGEILVTLVVCSEKTSVDESFASGLAEAFPNVKSVVLNINGEFTSAVLGRNSRVLYGDGYIRDTLLGKTFRISSGSFYQVNPAMAGRLYSKALDLIELRPSDTVIDAYCGTGTIGIIASDRAASVLGIENNAGSVRDAKENARINGVKNISFIKADASVYMEKLASSGEHIDALIMDPPRSGSTVRFMKSVKILSPDKLVYISCDPESLSRDLGWLTRNGYAVKKICPFDMFPFTDHVETVCCLYHQKKDFISVPYEPKDVK